ncbi:MAG TPA: Ppx/GppA phosphatase family protein [Acidothermaceae bacterium]|jgi:exopolyphosphatase/guanosine-5'-triphosphate,3'-diphosphate pyrophosphatase|nr:Ppx/GppA phosphatase family protein [Acidothermaceae bacterium]
MTRVAALDCGTNSLRLLIADIDPVTGDVIDVDRETRIVRLGQGVDQTRRFADDALARTFAVCHEYAALIDARQVERVRFVATSASRDVSNRDAFVDGVRQALAVVPEVITGNEEAALSFAGATRELIGAVGTQPPYLVIDIGGGSTEFVIGARDVEAARSVDIGCVRLTERHLHDDPPTPAQIEAARADIVAGIDLAAQTVPFARASTVIGLAGSVTTVAAIALELLEYDEVRIHHSRITASQIHQVTQRLLAMSRADRAALPVMHPGRVDVIGAGALVLDTIVAELGVPEVVVSEHDILDGIALSIAG